MVNKWLKNTLILLLTLFHMMVSYGYSLPNNKTEGNNALFKKNSQGTYNVYLKLDNGQLTPHFVYVTKPKNLDSYEPILWGKNIGIIFYYQNEPTQLELVLYNPATQEISPVYPGDDFPYPDQYNVMADADSENGPRAIFIHPIFKSQPKVWIVIQREFKMWFPGVAGAESDFLKNGDLYIVLTTDPKERYPVAKKTETLPIDYSVFNKPVDKPTCYALPEDHKLRLCTKEEAQLRSPALKVFLGEQ